MSLRVGWTTFLLIFLQGDIEKIQVIFEAEFKALKGNLR